GLAARAADGDRMALEAVVSRITGDVYNLALRMLGHPADAEDATQEILVKVVTRLATFRGDSTVRTWVWRVAANHLLSTRRGRGEPPLSFEALEGRIAEGLTDDTPAPPPPDAALLEEEVRLGCTQAMLMCLGREERLAYLLAAVFELTGDEAAAVLEVQPAAFRKRLSRAREALRAFLDRACGLVEASAPCRCARQVGPCVRRGMLDAARPVLAVHPRRAQRDTALWRYYEAIGEVDRAVALFRSHPDYREPESLARGIRAAIEAAGI
ncbi:MAG TPA: RNA polymerase sigma factor, partial [Terriglobales bacterium]|nr:RNA polymerase sigma factor [Terriglobales bacterium]